MAENWISLYEEYAGLLDAPPHYHSYVGYAVLGCAAGKRVWVQGWDSKIHPNLFLLLLGASGRARKTTSIKTGTKLLAAVSVPEAVGTASPESIRDEFHPEKGIRDPDAWFHVEEFGRLLKLGSKDYARDLHEFYCQLYDGSVKGRTKKEGRVLRNDLAVTVFTACPQETLEAILTEEDWSTGFMPRFIVIPPPTVYPPINYDPAELDRFKHDMLIGHLSKLRTMEPHKAEVAPEAAAIIKHACQKLGQQTDAGEIPQRLWPSVARLQESAWRFALAHACADLSIPLPAEQQPVIRVTHEDAKEAVRRVQWLVTQLADLFSRLTFTPDAADIQHIERQIEEAGQLSWRDISRSNRRIPSPNLREILKRLASEGTVTISTNRKPRGPTTTFYSWGDNGKGTSRQPADDLP